MDFGDFISEASEQQGKRLPLKDYNGKAKDSPIKAKAGGGRKSTVKQPKGHEASKRNQAYGGESEEQYNPPKYRKITKDLRKNGGQVMVPGKPPYKAQLRKPDNVVKGEELGPAIDKIVKSPSGNDAVENLKKKALEKAFKKDAKGHPKIEEGRMNFSDYINSAITPLYEKEGALPKCPPGYRYDAKLVMCVPKTAKDSVGRGEKSGDKDLKPGQGAHYNVWGNTGYNGAGYAWEEGPTTNDKTTGNFE